MGLWEDVLDGREPTSLLIIVDRIGCPGGWVFGRIQERRNFPSVCRDLSGDVLIHGMQDVLQSLPAHSMCLLHADVTADMDVNILTTIASTVIEMRGRDDFNLQHRRPSGRLFFVHLRLVGGDRVIVCPDKVETGPSAQPTASFSLGLDEGARRAREGLILPHHRAQQPAIEYEDEDYDPEDPDDDLDI